MYPEIKYDEQILLDRINSTTPAELDRALNAEKASFGDFLSLLSPLAAGELPRMRERARKFRLSHFGRVARLYAPIYFSNFCVNNCVYCGFRHSNHFPRRRLSIEETLAEAAILKKWGLDNVLIIAGEDKQTCSMDYLVPLIRELKKEFSYVSIELAPMTEEEYRTLFEAGAHGVSLYQETYDRPLYAELHPSGPKRDYDNRIHAPALAAPDFTMSESARCSDFTTGVPRPYRLRGTLFPSRNITGGLVISFRFRALRRWRGAIRSRIR